MDNTVIVIDDHDIVRLGLETLIAGSPHLRLLGSAASLREGLHLIERHRPALVITDMGTGDSSGLATVRAVLAAQGPRATLVLSMHDELLYGESVMTLGASGYVMKERASTEIVSAALAALKGELWMSPRSGAATPAVRARRLASPRSRHASARCSTWCTRARPPRKSPARSA